MKIHNIWISVKKKILRHAKMQEYMTYDEKKN